MDLCGLGAAVSPYYLPHCLGAVGPEKPAQLLAAYLIELAGIFGVEKADFSWRKVIGMAAAIVGVAVFQWE